MPGIWFYVLIRYVKIDFQWYPDERNERIKNQYYELVHIQYPNQFGIYSKHTTVIIMRCQRNVLNQNEQTK